MKKNHWKKENDKRHTHSQMTIQERDTPIRNAKVVVEK